MSSDAQPAQSVLSATAAVTIFTLTGFILAGWAALYAALPPGLPDARAIWAALCQPVSTPATFWLGYQAALAVWLPMVPAMMLPSAIPMALAFADRIERRGGTVRPVLLLIGYLGVWLIAAAILALIQTLGSGALAQLRLPEKALGIMGGFAIGMAGLWQFAPLKQLSLAVCRHDFSDVTERPGFYETFRLGVGQGLACIGCCWVLMLAAAAAGAMNLVWMAILAAVMTAEKMIGPRATAPLGLLLIAIGVGLAISAVGPAALRTYWLG